MKASTMRNIDWYVGVPLCYVLAFITWVGKKLFPSEGFSPEEVRTVVVAKFFGIGSLTLALPAISALQESFPKAKVRLLTFSGNKEAAELLGLGAEACYIDTRSLPRFIFSTFACAWRLRLEGVDLLMDLEFFAKFPLILGFLMGARRKAGFYLTIEPWRRALLDDYGYYNHYRHVKDIFLSLVYLVRERDPYYVRFEEFAERHEAARLPARREDILKVREKLARAGFKKGQKLLLINPNAGKELAPEIKRWSPESFRELSGKVADFYQDSVFMVFTGALSEREYVGDILSYLEDKTHVYNSAGEFNLRELLAVLSMADLLVTIDSGTMHLASLVDAPMVALFFAETPVLFGPTGKHSKVICSDLYSVPMLTAYTGKQPFLNENIPARLIGAEEVFQSVRKMLK